MYVGNAWGLRLRFYEISARLIIVYFSFLQFTPMQYFSTRIYEEYLISEHHKIVLLWHHNLFLCTVYQDKYDNFNMMVDVVDTI
jgi:lysophospholipid acyltransferase (LPLAT)-like uncharacterized protein